MITLVKKIKKIQNITFNKIHTDALVFYTSPTTTLLPVPSTITFVFGNFSTPSSVFSASVGTTVAVAFVFVGGDGVVVSILFCSSSVVGGGFLLSSTLVSSCDGGVALGASSFVSSSLTFNFCSNSFSNSCSNCLRLEALSAQVLRMH